MGGVQSHEIFLDGILGKKVEDVVSTPVVEDDRFETDPSLHVLPGTARGRPKRNKLSLDLSNLEEVKFDTEFDKSGDHNGMSPGSEDLSSVDIDRLLTKATAVNHAQAALAIQRYFRAWLKRMKFLNSRKRFIFKMKILLERYYTCSRQEQNMWDDFRTLGWAIDKSVHLRQLFLQHKSINLVQLGCYADLHPEMYLVIKIFFLIVRREEVSSDFSRSEMMCRVCPIYHTIKQERKTMFPSDPYLELSLIHI